MTITQLLWDNDGTLVDSEVIAMPIAVDVVNNHLAQNGSKKLPDDAVMTLAGKSFELICKAAEEHSGLTLPLESLDVLQRQTTIDALAANVEACPTILSVLAWIQGQKIDQSVVTSSSHKRVLPGLERVGMLDTYFAADRVFSAEDTLSKEQHKPHPQIYLNAMKTLDKNPEECLAVEDSSSGIKAAVAAGVKVIGYVGGSHIPDDQKGARTELLRELGATYVISDFADLPGIINTLSKGEKVPGQVVIQPVVKKFMDERVGTRLRS